MPKARTNDPATSHAAAKDANFAVQTWRDNIYWAVNKWPGRTARELADHMGVPYENVHKRMKEIETEQRIRRGDERECSIGGRKATTWYPRVKDGLFA